MGRRRWLLILVVLALAACRSTSPPEESEDVEQEYVDSLATVFTSGNAGPALDDATAECAATAMVRLVTASALRSADITPTELADADDLKSLDVQLPDDAVADLSEGLGACQIAEAMAEPFIRALASQSGSELSDDAVDCVVGAASPTALQDGIAATLVDQSNGDQAYDEITRAVGTCPSAMTELLVNSYEESAGAPLEEATRECVADQVEADPEGAATTFTTGGAAAGAFAAALLAACPDVAAA